MSLTILNKRSAKEISQRKMETYEKYCLVINWGRQNPVAFTSRFMGIELLDIQKYAFVNSWVRDFVLWLESRNAGKTTKLAIYPMTRSLLFPFHVTYYLGNTGEQAKESFKKVEKIAKKEIESFTGCTDLFFSELKRNTNSDGFVHNPASFSLELFNGSEILTLNSDFVNIKGKRASLVCFDEAGWFSDELFVQAENFVNQSENFKLGGNIDMSIEPKSFPRQLLYASSASDVSSEFYKKFKNFSRQMLMGNQKYFVCNFTVDTVMKAKFNGEEYPPLISQDKVDKALADNHDKAMRELYNHFSADSHDGQIVTRRDLRQCTVNRPPLLFNDTGNRLFALAWDSARMNDNSFIAVAEYRLDEEKGWCMDVHNAVCLVDIMNRKKAPMIVPEQVARFKELLLAYNGNDKGKLDYENIKAVLCDSGAGGQMIGGVSDYLLEEWEDKSGNTHKGLIDRNHKANTTAKYKFPDAVDIVKLIDPKGNRNAIFESVENMIKLGVVTFPAEYDTDKKYISVIDDNGEEIRYDLTFEEQLALAQIELMKTEAVTMCKYESKGNITYNFPPDKRNKMHDDRAYTLGLLCFFLAQLRRGTIVKRDNSKSKLDIGKLMRKPSVIHS